MKKVAIVSTHPIQYHTPWYRALACEQDLHVEVLYCHQSTAQDQAGAGFGVAFDWDVSLLDGYRFRFLRNVAAKAGVSSFSGADTPELAALIAGGRYDAVVVNGWHYKSAWQAIRACWKSRVPVLVRSDSHLRTPRHALKSLAKSPVYRWFIPRFDACLPVGGMSRDYFLHYGASPANVFVVPHIVDVERIVQQASVLEVQRNELRRQWDLPESRAVFVFVAKFIEKKRPLDFVRALARACRARAQVCGLMVGDGPLRPLCEAEAAASGVPVRFAGFLNQSQITRAYVAADALVLPSDGRETWGVVVNEAMTCGRPCFVSDQVGCAVDLVERKRTGDIFPCGDLETLAGILREYGDASRLASMRRRVREKMDSYSPAAAAKALREAIFTTIGGRSCSVS